MDNWMRVAPIQARSASEGIRVANTWMRVAPIQARSASEGIRVANTAR